ncbi:hypothetical protein CC85DRAFT_109113 [Cutaneotrichosporon oleaginosum]|uniref:Uncharacterized protein n=1 Tax=Cutaneotrichosporon oleaginosum TaxID=879819 RepID=A0A0J0XKL5_9TREE|nr:uncharacterized protein CC85DRAFT_109113 [Cutaneotrichosporon oleaginosum]KLT41602.1 hypothetical protein CC85DRAFT_109113 [Cutaneotrichosporon oleaginosum]TXT08159.1 hypothetical protein COLE_05083 [Cutaneotrichosporon oleaginosum]
MVHEPLRLPSPAGARARMAAPAPAPLSATSAPPTSPSRGFSERTSSRPRRRHDRRARLGLLGHPALPHPSRAHAGRLSTHQLIEEIPVMSAYRTRHLTAWTGKWSEAASSQSLDKGEPHSHKLKVIMGTFPGMRCLCGTYSMSSIVCRKAYREGGRRMQRTHT